jgi:hypothetical protein
LDLLNIGHFRYVDGIKKSHDLSVVDCLTCTGTIS